MQLHLYFSLVNQVQVNPLFKINYDIDASVDFLDVTITNEGGHLSTSIYYKKVAEPYILPYASDHPRHVHRTITYAARLCSDYVYIDVSLFFNKHSLAFISRQFNRFFHLIDALLIVKHLDKQAYHRLHRALLHQWTRREEELTRGMNDPIEFPRFYCQRCGIKTLCIHITFLIGDNHRVCR